MYVCVCGQKYIIGENLAKIGLVVWTLNLQVCKNQSFPGKFGSSEMHDEWLILCIYK